MQVTNVMAHGLDGKHEERARANQGKAEGRIRQKNLNSRILAELLTSYNTGGFWAFLRRKSRAAAAGLDLQKVDANTKWMEEECCGRIKTEVKKNCSENLSEKATKHLPLPVEVSLRCRSFLISLLKLVSCNWTLKVLRSLVKDSKEIEIKINIQRDVKKWAANVVNFPHTRRARTHKKKFSWKRAVIWKIVVLEIADTFPISWKTLARSFFMLNNWTNDDDRRGMAQVSLVWSPANATDYITLVLESRV